MNEGNRKLVEAPQPPSFHLRGTSTVSLHERFSQVVPDQLTRSTMRTFDPVVLQQRRRRGTPKTCDLGLRQLRRRRSVWTRLGWLRSTRRRSAFRPRGFWSFTNKYRWRTSYSPAYRGQTHLKRGGATGPRRRSLRKDHVPTKKQLDAQLDEYMSMSKSRLDKDLDEYMSMSKSRLDAELDEYMSMTDQTFWV